MPRRPAQYPLWELFPAGEPNTTLLNSPAGFLDDKAVLLFLESEEAGLAQLQSQQLRRQGSK